MHMFYFEKLYRSVLKESRQKKRGWKDHSYFYCKTIICVNICILVPVLWIWNWIHMDPLWFGSPGSWSAWIRFDLALLDPDSDSGAMKLFKINEWTWFPAFHKGFCTYSNMFYDLDPEPHGAAWIRIGMAPWIRIRTDVKSWIWIRTETNVFRKTHCGRKPAQDGGPHEAVSPSQPSAPPRRISRQSGGESVPDWRLVF